MRAARLSLTLALFGLFLLPLPASAQKLPSPSHRAFILYEFDIHDPEAFKTISAEVRDSLKSYKGEFVMRQKVDSIFGGEPSNLAVASFPSVEDARAWLASPAVAKLKAERNKVSTVNTYLVEQL